MSITFESETLSNYDPPWYLRSGHIQTLITGFYRPKAVLPAAIQHRIPIGKCGDMLIHENSPAIPESFSSNRSDPATVSTGGNRSSAVLLLHGLGSSHSGTYMTNIASDLMSRGHRVFRVDLPGAGKSFQYTMLPAHGACYPEIWKCLLWMRDHLQIQSWRIGGVSLGGNIVLKLLAEKCNEIDSGDGSREISITKAVALAPPIDLAVCCHNMERGFNRFYNKYFIRALKKQTIERAKIWPEWNAILDKASYSSIRDFDQTVTAPLSGFQSGSDYYEAGSSLRVLSKIDVPTSVLIDEHDPIVPLSVFENVKWSDSTQIFRTLYGGHVGYLGYDRAHEGSRSRSISRWADSWIVDELLRS